MTESQTIEILMLLSSAFSRFEFGNGGDMDRTKVQLWHEMFEDKDYEVVKTAVKKLVLENKYAPAISEVREKIAEIENPQEITGAEAFEKVIKAIRNYGYMREREALNSLPDRAARVAKMMGWQELCKATEIGVARGQFLKMYEQVSQRDKEEQILPEGLKQRIEGIGKLQLEDGNDGTT